MASSSNPKPVFPFIRPQIPSSVTSDGMISQETPTPKPRSRKRKSDKKDHPTPVLQSDPVSAEKLGPEAKVTMKKRRDSHMMGGSSSRGHRKEKVALSAASKEDESSSSEESMDLGDFDTTGISNEEMELWSQFAPQDQQLMKSLKKAESTLQQSLRQRRPSAPNSAKKSHMSRMEKYIRDHPFFAQQSVFKFSTTQRRAFERDVYDHARGLNYSKANAKKQVVTARHLCGEKDYDSDNSRLGSEIDDSEAVLVRKSGHVNIQDPEVPNGGITKKRKLEPTKDVASEDERPSKKTKKGKALKQAGTENQIPPTLDKKTVKSESSKVDDLRIRVIRSVITAMVEIIQRHVGCNCDSREFISNDPTMVGDEHGKSSTAPLMGNIKETNLRRLRKKLHLQFNSPPLRSDKIPDYKALMPLIQNKNNIKSMLMRAWRVPLSHGARDEFERSFHDIIGGPEDFDELLRLAPANERTSDDEADAADVEQHNGVVEVPPDIPAKKPESKKSKKEKKREKRLKDMNPEKGIHIDPLVEPWSSIGVHEAQQASLGEGNSNPNKSAATELPPSGTVENENALADVEKALAKVKKAKRKAVHKKEMLERDLLKLKEAKTHAGASTNEFIPHSTDDELSGIINGLHDASLKQEPQDIMEKPSDPTIQPEHFSNAQSASTAYQSILRSEPRELIEISSSSPSPPPERPKKWTKEQKHKALQADTWLMHTGESADGFPDRLEATFEDLERKKGFRFTYEEQLRIQDMLQANYGDSYSGDELQDQILDRIAAIQSRDEMIPPTPKKSKGKEKEKSRAKSVSRNSGFQFPMIR